LLYEAGHPLGVRSAPEDGNTDSLVQVLPPPSRHPLPITMCVTDHDTHVHVRISMNTEWHMLTCTFADLRSLLPHDVRIHEHTDHKHIPPASDGLIKAIKYNSPVFLKYTPHLEKKESLVNDEILPDKVVLGSNLAVKAKDVRICTCVVCLEDVELVKIRKKPVESNEELHGGATQGKLGQQEDRDIMENDRQHDHQDADIDKDEANHYNYDGEDGYDRNKSTESINADAATIEQRAINERRRQLGTIILDTQSPEVC